MVQQLAMVIDSTKCIDCKGCVAACKVANKVPEGQWRNWIKHDDVVPIPGVRMQGQARFQPGACMHCDTPSCVSACPTGATYKHHETGEVVIDTGLCIGCGNCLPACPYGARYRNELTRKADKCNYCSERRANGLLPACVDTCPTKARVFGDINDPTSEAGRLYQKHKDSIHRLVAKTDTLPNMYYINDPGPQEWPGEAVIPASMVAMQQVAPGVRALVGLSGLGVLVMLGRQFLTASRDDQTKEDGDA
jgi:tetrathionate reductase subunit B